MNLESLPNELLLDIFEYFSVICLLQTFYNLNSRLNNVIFCHFQIHTLNLQSISKYDFDIICQRCLPSIANRIIFLRLSDDDDTPNQLDLFFSYGLSFDKFIHLQSLSVHHVYALHSLKKIINELFFLPHLTHLNITRHTVIYNEIYDIGIIKSIRHLKKLVYCHLDIINDNEHYFLTPPIVSSSLQYLSIPYLDCTVNELTYLIKQIPNLQSLSICIVDYSISSQKMSIRFRSIQKLKMIFFGNSCSLNKLLEIMPNLKELNIELETTYIDGYQWKTMIENYLPYLSILRFKMVTSLSNQQNKEEQIDSILNSFRDLFWIQIHQWFIQCNWRLADSSSIVYVYTLPYAFLNFFHMGNVRLKSTCPHDNPYWSFKSIHNLYYGYVLTQTSYLSPIQLENIHYLDLIFPFDESLWSIVAKLERLKSLNVVLHSTMNCLNIQSKLEILFDRSPHLHSLKFVSWFPYDEFPFNIQHSSIRKLDLQGPNIVYDQKLCFKLSHSLIGQQCQVLIININDRTAISELINNMKNLRALIVQSTEKNSRMQNKKEDLVEWLQNNLSLKCAISSTTEISNNIRLWIR